MQEIWKPIEGYEDKYQVSNFGRIKSLKDKYGNYREKMLKTHKYSGYLYVQLCLNNKHKWFRVHRLVAQSFIPNPDNLKEVNHLDENKENNSVENLEWATRKYNVRYSLSKKVGCYKEGKLIKIYNSTRDTEKDGFNHGSVSECCNGKRKSHAGFTWRYI